MTLVFQRESYEDIVHELPAIFHKHWLETENHKEYPLDVSWDDYRQLSTAKMLHIMTARDDGELVGYIFSIIHPQLHYRKVKTAYTDGFYLRPQYVKGFGIFRYARLILQSEKELRDMGVQRRYIAWKAHLDLEKLMLRLGYEVNEKVGTKLL